MSKPFDATLKDLGAECPEAFVQEFDGTPRLPVTVLNVNLSTVTTAADLVFGLGDPLQEILRIDCQASSKGDLPADLHAYSSLIYRRYQVPVHSIALLLRPEARHRNLTGRLEYAARPERGGTIFEYEVIALWERPVEHFLNGPLAMAPLAMLAKVPEGLPLDAGLRGIAERLCERLVREAPTEKRDILAASAYILTGLRVDRELAWSFFQGVQGMQESSTYRAILDEGAQKGALKEARKLLLRGGQRKFGPANEDVIIALNAISDLERLERLHDRIVDVASWNELLQLP